MLDQEFAGESLTEHSLGYAGLSIFSICANSANSCGSDNYQNELVNTSFDQGNTPETSYNNDDKGFSKVVTPRKSSYSSNYSNGLQTQTNGSSNTQLMDEISNNKNYSNNYEDQTVDINRVKSLVSDKLFWLETREICGLIPIPQISNSESLLSTKSYIAFTPYSLDVLEDLTTIYGQLPNGQRPFVLIHSYAFDSMYFQVKLCDKKFDHSSITNDYSENTGNKYVFYRSHLGSFDNGDAAEKIRVTINPIKGIKHDSKSAKQQIKRSKSSNTILSSKTHENPVQNTISGWVYEEANLDSENDPFWNVPMALVKEVKFITGVATKKNILRADASTANHRYNAMLNRTFVVEGAEPSTSLTGDDSYAAPDTKKSSFSVTTVPGKGVNLNKNDVVKVRFESDYFGYDDEDLVRVFDDDQLSAALELMVTMPSNQAPNLSVINLAQHCPNIFWNLAFKGNVEDRLACLSPNVYNRSCKRRRRNVNLPEQKESEMANNASRNVSKMNYLNKLKSLHYDTTIENNFTIMQNIYRLDAEAKIANLEKLEYTTNAVRHRPLLTLDDREIVEAVIDSSGAMKWSISSLTEHQRRVVYAECLSRNYFPPIYLILSPNKGRGVEAAYTIHKDDFVMEYKGELVSEKEAKERDKKYNQKSCFGSFIFYFKHDGKHYSIDSTKEYAQYGAARLINHSRKNPNLAPKTLYVANMPRLFFIAKRTINKGEELLVDYGERDPDVIRDNPWLNDS